MEKINFNISMYKSHEFKAIRELTDLEFSKYSDYILKLVLLKNDENLFRIVELNYVDFITRLDEITKRLNEGSLYTEEQQHLHLEVNRLILNFLSSIRTYLDHTETRLKRAYGEESNDYKLFKSETSEAYDKNFAYRFLYKLRNYSQHCGLPAGSLATSSLNENGKAKHSLKLSLLRDDLLQNFDWGKPITEELRNKENTFDILSLIETKFNLLQTINDNIKFLSYKHYKEEGFALFSLLQEIENRDGIPCILKSVNFNNQTKLDIQWFPLDSITKITGIPLY